jgi:DNA-binding MurR/RpiR family transcriptional regulator
MHRCNRTVIWSTTLETVGTKQVGTKQFDTEPIGPTGHAGSVGGRLVEVSGQLTPTERRLAQLIEDDPTILAFDTVADLADRVGTSGPTIVRFATKLGFGGYSALQREVRSELADRLKKPTDRIRASPSNDLAASSRRAAHQSVDDAFDRCSDDLREAIADAVAGTPGRVWIVASETSSPVAQLLASNLRLIRPGVHHVTGSRAAVAATLIDASEDDAVIAIDVARYERSVVETSRLLAARGATVVAITDGPLSPLAAIADHWCGVTVPAVGPFDSALPIVAVAELLTAAVALRLQGNAAARLDVAEAGWLEHGVFEESPP